MVKNVLKRLKEERENPVTDIRINPTNHDVVKATVTCKIAGMMYLRGIRIMHGRNGRFISMPAYKDQRGEFRDFFFPASKEVRDLLSDAILKKYDEIIEGGK